VPASIWQPGYVPARELGGDFYDFLPYGQGRLGFMLAMFSGKGTAARYMVPWRSGTVREIVVDHACEPACMLALSESAVARRTADSRFIAMLFLPLRCLDSETHARQRRRAVSPPGPQRSGAGHLPGRRAARFSFPDTQYDETTLTWQPGAVVVFASDGILDRRIPRRKSCPSG